jgi:hypothetical protein
MADTTRRSSGRDNPEPRQKKKRAFSRPALIVSGLCFVAGIVLLGMGTARTVAAWTSFGAEPAMAKLRNNEFATGEQLTQCVEALERAIAWAPAVYRLANLGSCELGLARRAARDSSERKLWLDRAEAHTERSLRGDPTNGYNWARLALIRQARGDAARSIMPALMMSLEMMPNVQELWRLRVGMLLDYARLLPPDDGAALRRHLHSIWTFSPRHRPMLLKMAHRLNRVDILRAALANDPEAMAEIDMMERQSRFP